jgi:RNA polymerase sigma-70 factor (ECF subfamily)
MRTGEGAALLLRARDGSQEAVDLLLQRVAGKVLALVRLRMGPALRSRIESRDVLQATLLRAFEKLDELEADSTGSFMGWLIRIAENEIRDQVDFQHRQRRDLRREVAIDAAGATPAPVRSALSRLVLDERAKRLKDALDKLQPEQRELILLRRFQELPFAAIGSRLGIGADAARMRFARAMAALTLAIGEDG